MVEQIITYLNAKLTATGHFHTTYCLVEKKREPREDGDVVYPATYTGAGELEMVEFDAAGFAYFRKDGDITQAVEGNEFGQKQLYNVTIPLRLVAMVRRQDIVTDDAYSPDRLARDIATLLTFKNGDLRTGLNANRVLVTAANWQTDPEQIWSDETEGTGRIEPDYSRAFIAMSVTVEVLADEGCIRNACEFDPDILHLFDFCKPSVVARLTDRQVECLLDALPFPCEPATFTLINTATPSATLDSGSIPSGGSDVIVAPAVTVIAANSLNTQIGPTVTPPSGGSDVIPLPDVTHTQSDGSPETLPNGVPMVCTPPVTLTVTLSDTDPKAGDTVTATVIPPGVNSPTYSYYLSNGTESFVLIENHPNNSYAFVVPLSGTWEVLVLMEDGASKVWASASYTAAASYYAQEFPAALVALHSQMRENISAVNVIRARTGTSEQDIGFTGNDRDNSALIAFAPTSATMPLWFDQSPVGVDAVQTTASRQPIVVQSSAVVTESGYSAIQLNGAQTMQQSQMESVLSGVAQQFTFHIVLKIGMSSVQQNIFNYGQVSGVTLRNHALWVNPDSSVTYQRRTDSTNYVLTTPVLNLTDIAVLSCDFDGATGRVYLNGSLEGSLTMTPLAGNFGVQFGLFSNGRNIPGLFLFGKVFSVVLHSNSQFAAGTIQAQMDFIKLKYGI